MRLTTLLGKQLKDDDVVEVLESFNAEVTYDFDRTHENMPDRYWATSKEDGILMGFDEHQRLEVIFLYIEAIDGFTPVHTENLDDAAFRTLIGAEKFAADENILHTKGQGEILAIPRDWIRFEFEGHTVHYEYREDNLAMITLTQKHK